MTPSLRIAIRLLQTLLILLVASWSFTVWSAWAAIAARPARVAYLVSDLAVIVIPGLAATLALGSGRRWARVLFPAVIGAFQYAVVHNVLYLLRDNYLRVPPFVILSGLAGFTVFSVFALSTLGNVSGNTVGCEAGTADLPHKPTPEESR